MRSTRNETACAALLDNVNWSDGHLILSLSILVLIDAMVIVGNCLVILAVFYSSKLRSVTNLFIVSLAVADLLVGIAVLPFSAVWEVYKVWIFGNIWCSMWLSLDVWMCTASILNLCAISLDRYVAVTRSITYPSIMSPKRAKLLIAGLWILSFVICFPPLVGWKDSQSAANNTVTNTTIVDTSFDATHCPWKCELTNEAGYVIYSALGSFYIPMFVMLFFYWRIYKAAVRTTRAINQGFRTTKGSRRYGNRFDEQRLTLRIHRGRGSSGKRHPQSSSPMATLSNGSNSTLTTGGSLSPSPSSRGRHEREKIKISVSYPSTEDVSAANTSPHLLGVGTPTSSPRPNYAVHYSVSNGGNNNKDQKMLRVQRLSSRRRAASRRASLHETTMSSHKTTSPTSSVVASEEVATTSIGGKKLLSKRMGKRNVKTQVRRFRMETKAAKTLAIIVGGFICCWLPFFTVYLLRAFCEDCIHPLVFSVLFWLGYCNSAINPLIYALFSKDFRFAFKQIICRCLCRRDRTMSSSRRGSDGSQTQTQGRHFRSPSFNVQNAEQTVNSLGEESDYGQEPCDSR